MYKSASHHDIFHQFTPTSPSCHFPQHNTMDPYPQFSETDPLLPIDRPTIKKPFYRPRPLWIVPFALTAAVVRGMTIAPRVQVYTQLTCNTLHGQQNDGPFGDIHPPHVSSPSTFGSEHPVPIPVHFLHFSNLRQDDGAHGPPQLVSQGCLSDPAVQAGAARLQAVMITVMGVLSACTTSWWGHYGQKHGRNKVLAASTIGLLLTDLTFVLASTPSSPFSRYGGKFLFLAPVIEGILGGHVTQQAAVSAYISDCTSDGSRAHIFSRLAGVSHVGIALGPTLGAFLIRHSLLHVQSLGLHHREGQTVTAVFWAAILCCAINFLLILLVIPESLEKARLRAAQKEDSPVVLNKPTLKKRLLGPLAIFVPRKRLINGHLQKDWSMSWLATAVFALLLANGVYPVKYLYAGHVFGWSAEELSYYITCVSCVRAFHTLVLMPFLISTFKPSSAPTTPVPVPPSAPTANHLARSITFDVCVARVSLLLDITSHSLVALHLSSSPLIFTGITSISALASGTFPALESLAICILQRSRQANPELGALFGGLGTLTALGQTILAPVIFGIFYSTTVAYFPEAVFVLAAALVFVALSATFLIRTEPPRRWKGKAPAVAVATRRRVRAAERDRGRSRVVKHIGDRTRKPARPLVPTPDSVSAAASQSTASCSSSSLGSSDDLV
ncbi:major facilitator superfamily domain-containing protein [Lactifluus volemus]|nr:major facilitator superfamily domain-containing protein [Lactifluus volemus]